MVENLNDNLIKNLRIARLLKRKGLSRED